MIGNDENKCDLEQKDGASAKFTLDIAPEYLCDLERDPDYSVMFSVGLACIPLYCIAPAIYFFHQLFGIRELLPGCTNTSKSFLR